MKAVPAREWKELSNMEMLASVETALRVLRERRLGGEERRYAGELAKDLIDLAVREP